MFMVHFIPCAIILPFLSLDQGINPFTRMGSICCEKKKKQKAIRIGCHDPHHLSQLDDD